MKSNSTELGFIEITPLAIAKVAGHAAIRSYGVVGLAAKSGLDRLGHALTKDANSGIAIQQRKNSGIEIDLYVILEYGTNLAAVSDSLANTVRYQVQQTLGILVSKITVHVQGLRFSNELTT
jgi:uncharacterized alkaline shock family protein YloU